MYTTKGAKMKRKITKALLQLNINLDAEQKKLYDRTHNLELSHNRDKRFLNKIDKDLKQIQDDLRYKSDTECIQNIQKLRDKINLKLCYPYLRTNWGVK